MSESSDYQHTMKAVSKQTGISPDLIRAWEKRYGVVKPTRTQTNRRLYSESDIERLRLLKQATDLGHSIGQLSRVDTEDLKRIVSNFGPSEQPPLLKRSSPDEIQAACFAAAKALDGAELHHLLGQAGMQFGHAGAIAKVIAPLINRIGSDWLSGALTVSQEHLISGTIRDYLISASLGYVTPANAPELIVATPSGQVHEMGAIIVSSAARNIGWRVTHLGLSLPAEELAGAVNLRNAKAIGLSIVYPSDDMALPGELRKLKSLIPPDVLILIGGRAATSYHRVLEEIGAIMAVDLDKTYEILEKVRARLTEVA